MVELPPVGRPPEGECDHCGCRVIDWGNGWEYVEQDERLPEYDGGTRCSDAPDEEHTVGGANRGTPEPPIRTVSDDEFYSELEAHLHDLEKDDPEVGRAARALRERAVGDGER